MTSGLPRPTECRACAAPIRFVKLNTGKAMPVNPMPNPAGNVAAYQVGGQLHGHVISRERPAPGHWQRFTAHYATCEEQPRRDPKPEPDPPPALF